jgi:hypothetical protein
VVPGWIGIHFWILVDYWNYDAAIELRHYNAKTLQQPFLFVSIPNVSHHAVEGIKSLAEAEHGFQNDFSKRFLHGFLEPLNSYSTLD